MPYYLFGLLDTVMESEDGGPLVHRKMESWPPGVLSLLAFLSTLTNDFSFCFLECYIYIYRSIATAIIIIITIVIIIIIIFYYIYHSTR